jgi:hypothetical protein
MKLHTLCPSSLSHRQKPTKSFNRQQISTSHFQDFTTPGRDPPKYSLRVQNFIIPQKVANSRKGLTNNCRYLPDLRGLRVRWGRKSRSETVDYNVLSLVVLDDFLNEWVKMTSENHMLQIRKRQDHHYRFHCRTEIAPQLCIRQKTCR